MIKTQLQENASKIYGII